MRIAAYDKRLQSDSWKLLEVGRKELLLPLRDEKLLREAAEHVEDSTLGLAATREYINNLRSENGLKVTPRVMVVGLTKAISGVRGRLTSKAFLRRFGEIRESMEPAAKETLKADIRALEEALAARRKKLDE